MQNGLKEGIIAGSVGKDIKNNSINCCDNINIWNKIIPDSNSDYLNNMHVLNSWFILTKNNINTNFLNDWSYWCVYKSNEFILCGAKWEIHIYPNGKTIDEINYVSLFLKCNKIHLCH